jgi:SAM-dependent methyltransferase
MNAPEEPLLESAPIARRLAPRLCLSDPATSADCSPVHGTWQYLRILGFVTTPHDHAVFLRDALAQAAPAGRGSRVLISGAMDYSMLAHVWWAHDLRRTAADVTVMDICETPLHLNRWYAERAGRAIHSARADVMEFSATPPFDVICTHSLLSQFEPPRRRELVERWHRLLQPGGRVITVNRLRPGAGGASFTYSDAQVEALRDDIIRRAAPLQGRLGLDPEVLARDAVSYARHRRIHPVASCDELAGLFGQAGFVVEHLSSATVVPGPLHASATSSDALYAHLVARRP